MVGTVYEPNGGSRGSMVMVLGIEDGGTFCGLDEAYQLVHAPAW